MRYFGLYSSKSRGKWQTLEHVIKHAPDGWKEQYGLESQNDDAEIEESCSIDEVEHKKSALSAAKKYSWAAMPARHGSSQRYMKLPP